MTPSPSSSDPQDAPERSKRLLIGVGNPDRGDDGAGREVGRRLLGHEPAALDVREATGEATALMDAWAGYDEVVVVDACRGAGPPGSVHRIGPEESARLAILRHASSHSLGVATAIGLARALGTLPRRLVVYAIEAGDSRVGAGLSPQVEQAVEDIVAAVRQGGEL